MKTVQFLFGVSMAMIAISFLIYTAFIIVEGATKTQKTYDQQLQEFINNQ